MVDENPGDRLDFVPNDDDGPWERVHPEDEAPEDRCGLTFEYGDERQHGGVTCWRESDSEQERCIWHTDKKSKPSRRLAAARGEKPERIDGAVLRNAELRDDINFTGCEFPGADCTGAYLRRADFSDAYLREADFTNADLGSANFTEAFLLGANFTNVFLTGGDLTDAYLHQTTLANASLEGADLNNAALHDADLTRVTFQNTNLDSVEVNSSTKFGGLSGHERRSDEKATDASPLDKLPNAFQRVLGRPATDPDHLHQAEIQYRTIQRLRREHDLSEQPEFDVREKNARRKRMLADRQPVSWLTLAAARWTTLYGESPWRVVATSFAAIIGFGLLYPITGGVLDGGTHYELESMAALTTPEGIEAVFRGLYFSVITFTTIGYANVAPGGPASRILVGCESFLGAALMALLVAVIARQITR